MAKSDAQIVKEFLDRMSAEPNEVKAREVTKVLGKRVRQRARGRIGLGQSSVRVHSLGLAGSILSKSVPRQRSAAAQNDDSRYSPIRIHGEPLSATILRDRGTYRSITSSNPARSPSCLCSSRDQKV